MCEYVCADVAKRVQWQCTDKGGKLTQGHTTGEVNRHEKKRQLNGPEKMVKQAWLALQKKMRKNGSAIRLPMA